MYCIYEITRMVNDVPTPDIIILFHPGICDFSRVLHELGIKYCVTKQGQQLCRDEGGLTLERLMDYITPEMLESYGITMVRPRETAIQVSQEPPIIGKYEAESYLRLCDAVTERLRQLYNNAKRFARRLESQQGRQNSVVATWSSEKISTKALVWANQFVSGKERNWEKFIKGKLDELTPDMCGTVAASFPAEGEPVGEWLAAQ